MTTNTLSQLTIKELTARIDPNGNSARIAEVLQEKNQILEDIPWGESNETFSNRTVRRSSEPTGTFRKLNEGVTYHASKTTPLIDVVGLLEDYSKTDKRLVEAAPNPVEFRNGEDMAFVSGMGKTIAYKMFYGNASVTPEEFTGFFPRMDATTDGNVIDAGGTGSDTTSIAIITWGLDACHGIYGRGSKAGLQSNDEGIQVMEDSSAKINKWYVTHFSWECGLVVRNPKCMGRIVNIESSKTAASNAFSWNNLVDLLVELEVGATTRIYLHRNLMAQAWKKLIEKGNVFFTRNEGLDAGGMPLSFNGIPMRQVDQLSITETAI